MKIYIMIYIMIYSSKHVLNDVQAPGLGIQVSFMSCSKKRNEHCQKSNSFQMLLVYLSGSSRRQYQ